MKTHIINKDTNCMRDCGTQILQRLAVLVVCHGLSVGKTVPQYILVRRLMSWNKAQEFCQRHYIDLAVLSTEEHYFTLCNATAANKDSFWLGLLRQNFSSAWKWVDQEDLAYKNWYRENHQSCASLEAMLDTDKKLLARYCEELHMFVCQGPDVPWPVMKDSVGSDQVSLSWNVSAFMQTTPHSYNVRICTNTCSTLVYDYTPGSGSMTIKITNLTSTTEFFIEISAFVVRINNTTGKEVILQSKSTALNIKTVDRHPRFNKIFVMLKLLKLVSLVPPLWIFYLILRKYIFKESAHSFTTDQELSAVETQVNLIPEKTGDIRFK